MIYFNENDIIDWNKALTRISGEPHAIIKSGISSAIHRAEYYDNPEDKAAALFHSLINNHYFLQANKRTALVALLTSLSTVNFSNDFLESLILDTIKDKLSVEDISLRLKNAIQNTPKIENLTKEIIFEVYKDLIIKLISL